MITGGRKQKAPTKAGAFHYNWCRKQESNLRPTHYECLDRCFASITYDMLGTSRGHLGPQER